MDDKRILQRELPFFLLLRWKYSLEERNESDYLAACQMVVAEDIPKEKWELLVKEYAEYPNNELSHIFTDITIDAPWTIFNKKETIFKYIFWERLDSLLIPECCFHFIWCQIA